MLDFMFWAITAALALGVPVLLLAIVSSEHFITSLLDNHPPSRHGTFVASEARQSATFPESTERVSPGIPGVLGARTGITSHG